VTQFMLSFNNLRAFVITRTRIYLCTYQYLYRLINVYCIIDSPVCIYTELL